MSKIRFLGLDVHADTITVAIADPGKEVSLYGKIPINWMRFGEW